MLKKIRLFVDMDGTLVQYQGREVGIDIFAPHYFENVPPEINLLNFIKDLIHHETEVEIYILSAIFDKKSSITDEKKVWLNTWLPELPEQAWYFPPESISKVEYMHRVFPDWNQALNILIDDMDYNLSAWQTYDNHIALESVGWDKWLAPADLGFVQLDSSKSKEDLKKTFHNLIRKYKMK